MNDKAFLDTNVLVYLYSEDDEQKRNAACEALNNHDCVTSTQVMNELSNVWFRKFNLSAAKIKEHLDNIESVCNETHIINRATINYALSLKERYEYSYFDSLMLASALESNCQLIFTEDMSNGQIIDNALKIINPFITN
ncbi:MAG: PIN domain-containing protein [Oscillospiraceae bacterium]|jgi:predicted nucleic acid-binding protein|nr:PIN domain-containing protein [Oscillospiraceae bacterium]